MTLNAYASKALIPRRPNMVSRWTEDEELARTHLCPRGIISRLIILHSALSRAHPLPPELPDLKIPDLHDYLSRQTPTDQEGFAAAALIHSVNWFLVRDVNLLTG